MSFFPATRRRVRIAAAMLALGLVTFLAVGRMRYQGIVVAGSSMEPTLHNGDFLLLDRGAYRTQPPRRDDLVIVWRHGERIVKRVVGLPGETVEVRRGVLYVDGRRLPSSHPEQPGFLEILRGHLVGDRYAVLGDNRSMTAEETVHAVVGPQDIAGRVVAWFSWRTGRIGAFGETPADKSPTAAAADPRSSG